MARILVADDSPDVLALLIRDLRQQGHDTRGVIRGEAALKVAASDRPDVILLDIMMPDMDGFEVCHRLKANEKTRSIAVIVVTALDRDDDIVKGLDAGADDYVCKPINRRLLHARIRTVLRAKGSYDEIERANERLRAEIASRESAEVRLKDKERQLFQAQKMEAVGCLTGGISHQFNNLLQVVKSCANDAMTSIESHTHAHLRLRQIDAAVDQAGTLTRQLLDFSRSEAVEPTPIDVNRVVRDVTQVLGQLLGVGFALEMDVDDAIERVRADRVQLEQVLLNLGINSRDAMPGGGTLRIATSSLTLPIATDKPETVSLSGEFVKITVQDNGCGMEPEVVERIFEPFFTTKEVGKGTGLGLSVACGVVQQHGGEITVESELGVGTTFSIFLPTESPCGDAEGCARTNLEYHEDREECSPVHGIG